MYLPGHAAAFLDNGLLFDTTADIQVDAVRHHSTNEAEKGVDYEQGEIVSLQKPGESIGVLAQGDLGDGQNDGGSSRQGKRHNFLEEKGGRHDGYQGIEQEDTVETAGVDYQQDTEQE